MFRAFTNRSAGPRLLVILCTAALVLAACSRKDEEQAAADMMMAAMALERELHIVTRPGYIERGETDMAYDWVTAFEAQTGCRVTVHTAATSEEMVALLARGGPQPSPPGDASWPPPGNAPFDLVTASGDVAIGLVRAGIVLQLDVTRIPSYASVDPRLQKAPWHYVDGQHYGVPFQWAPNLLLYNTDVFEAPPSSWSSTFEAQKMPDGKPNRGRIQAHGVPIYIADAALYLKAKNPALGIQDPYQLDAAQYDAVLALLRAQKPLVHRYWDDPNLQVRDFLSEDIVASASRPFQVNTLLANKAKVAAVVPAEGATGWADSTMLVTGARHPNCAYKWLEWSLTPKVQGDVAAWFGSNPSVPKACEGNELLGADGCQKNGIADFDKLAFWRTPEARCAAHPGGCVPYEKWVTDYTALMGGQ